MTEQEYMDTVDLTLIRSILKMVYEINDDKLRGSLLREIRPVIDELSWKVIKSIQLKGDEVMEKQINKLQHYAIENGFDFEGFDNIADVIINQLEKENEG